MWFSNYIIPTLKNIEIVRIKKGLVRSGLILARIYLRSGLAVLRLVIRKNMLIQVQHQTL